MGAGLLPHLRPHGSKVDPAEFISTRTGRIVPQSVENGGMPTKLSKEDQTAFNDGLAAYKYINDEGRLDLEEFCVTLAACLLHDGTGLERRGRPEAFHSLLLEILAER